MKKLSRLLILKNKRTPSVTQYNEFIDTTINARDRNKTVVPTVHNYGQKTKTKTTIKSKVQQLQQQTTKRSQSNSKTSNDNSINYASLERKRNENYCGVDNITSNINNNNVQQQKKRKKFFSKHCRRYKWHRFFNCLRCGNCCKPRKRSYKPTTMNSTRRVGEVNCTLSPTQKQKQQQPQQQRNFWLNCCQRKLCCCWHICCGRSYQYNSADEDDDIDGKVAAYLFEMKQREIFEQKNSTATSTAALQQKQSTKLQSKDLHDSCMKLINTNTTLMGSSELQNNDDVTTDMLNNIKATSLSNSLYAFRRRSQSQIKSQRRAWTWDDSLRSNSDRFLETLEEDDPCLLWGYSSVTFQNKTRQRTPLEFVNCVVGVDDHQFDVVINDEIVQKKLGNSNREEAKAAAAEDQDRSANNAQRNESVSSPLHSRGSTSSDAWPAQSDEDIDRLVAMHQNRSSLSSLGLRSDSMASVYSGAGEGRYGTVVVKGQVEFGMQYNYKLQALEIHVVRCKDLAAVDVKRNRSDPYVKVYLLPDKSKAGKRKTKVKKHTLNPIFDEVMRFHVPIASLETRTLWLTVWHSDMFGRNDFLGEVSVDLRGRLFDNPQSQWYLLQERSEPFDEVATYRGDIVVGLKYIPPESTHRSPHGFLRHASVSSSSGSVSNLRKFGSIKSVTSKADRSAKGGQLHVLVKEAKHLSPVKANGACDAFCKSYLLPDRTRSSKQKTPVIKRSLNPSWNYTFVYEDVSLDDLSERALELTVWDHDRLASNEFLGGIRFSLGTGKSFGRHAEWMDASGKELSLWQNMIDRPNFWVEGSLPLRSTLDGIRAIP